MGFVSFNEDHWLKRYRWLKFIQWSKHFHRCAPQFLEYQYA